MIGAIFLVIISMFSITTGASLAKQLFTVVGPGTTTIARLGIAALFLLVIWKPWREKITRSQFKIIALYGAVLGTMNLLFYFSIATLPLGLAIAIEFLGPLGVALYFSRKALDFVWVALAGLGIFLILPITEFQKEISIPGVAFAIGAAFCWAAYIIVGKRAGAVARSGVVTSIGMSVAFLVAMPFGVARIPDLFSSVMLIGTALCVGLLSSALPYSLEMVALKKIPSGVFGLLMSLEPAIGALMAWLIVSEKLTLTQLVAIACVMAASIGSSIAHSRKPAY